MSEALCPVCGKTAHPGGAGFQCSAEFRDPRKTDPDDSTTKVATPAAIAGAPRTSGASKLGKGAFVGEYRIEEEVGAGGMGTVYRGVQPLIGKRVAIKVLSGVLGKEDNAIKRFVLEARAVNEIGHPNLIDIFSFGQLTDGRYYYVMEFLEGESLAKLLRKRGRLEPAEAFPIFRDVGRALEAAHGKGIVHRDLKPDNVMLLPPSKTSGEPIHAKLLDFGLAKLLEPEVTAGGARSGPQTQAGMAVGTPPYMAPEQCMGKAVDARADIYALGVMLFETVCGRVPFQGKTMVEVWQGHVHKAPPRPSDLQPSSISPELDELILKSLAKKADDRIQTAGEFCALLLEIASAEGKPRKQPRFKPPAPRVAPPPPPREALRPAPAQPPPPPASLRAAAAPPPFELERRPASGDLVSPPDLLLPATPPSAPGHVRTPAALAPLSRAIKEGHLSDLVSLDRAPATESMRRPDPALRPPPVTTSRPDEVSMLREALGLSIVEPAFESADPSQVSALDIELHAAVRSAGSNPTLPPVVFPVGAVEERSRITAIPIALGAPGEPPPLDPPRPSRAVETKTQARRVVGGRSALFALAMLGLLALSALAWRFLI